MCNKKFTEKSFSVLLTSLFAVLLCVVMVNDVSAQRMRRPLRQQQIERRVRPVQKPAPAVKPAPAQNDTPVQKNEPKTEQTNSEKKPEPVSVVANPAPSNVPAAEIKENKAPEKKSTPQEKAQSEELKPEEKSATEENADELNSEEKPAEGENFDELNLEEKPAEEENFDELNLEEKPAEEENFDELNLEEKPAEEELDSLPEAEEGDGLEEAISEKLADPETSEDTKSFLKHASQEDIQKAVEEATAETENEDRTSIEETVQSSLKEVDEEAIDKSISEVMDSVYDDLENKENVDSSQKNEDLDLVPDSVQEVVESAEPEQAEPAETDMTKDEVQPENSSTDATPAKTRLVKLSELDSALQIPEGASYEELVKFMGEVDSLYPEDLESQNQDLRMEQIKTFCEKVQDAKLTISDRLLHLEGLTDTQWEDAISWKVQSLASAYPLTEANIAEMRSLLKEIEPRASKEILWKVESILIAMEQATMQEQPAPEELKALVQRMLIHTQKGIELNCVSLDFVFSTVQIVVLTEDILPQEESREVLESTITILKTSEMPQLKEMAKFLQKMLDQRKLIGQTPDLTLTTGDGKTLETADYVGKTLLIHCFSLDSETQVQELGTIYQMYMAFHAAGFEIIGVLPNEKNYETSEFLKKLPWPTVLAGNDVIEQLAIPTLPAKILVNDEGKIESTNISSAKLMEILEKKYGSVITKDADH